MGKILIILLGLSLIIERVTEKVLSIIRIGDKKVVAWIISTGLGILISFSFRFGLIQELGLVCGFHIARWVDYFVTGLLIASGSEPIHSIIEGLAFKRDELKRKAKHV